MPQDYATIQSGIDEANNGDIVLVAPGTYHENINFDGKAITVTSGATSAASASGTIISGATADATVTIYTPTYQPASSLAVLNGFTITHDPGVPTTSMLTGDGVALSLESATITNNLILQNPGCGFTANAPQSLLFQGNTVTSSSVGTCGTVDGVQYLGAAPVYSAGGLVQYIGNLVVNNVASGSSLPGFEIVGAPELVILDNTVAGNSGNGQPIYLSGDGGAGNLGGLQIIQNLVYGNTTTQAGTYGVAMFGIQNDGLHLTMTNNTIETPVNGTGALQLIYGGLSQDVENNILVAPSGAQAVTCFYYPVLNGDPIDVPPSYAVFGHNDVYAGGTAQSYTCAPAGANSAGNLSADPEFVDAAGGNFQTERTSPVVAAGSIHALDIPPTDLDGRDRTVCGTIDMGVYEVHPSNPAGLSSSDNPSVVGTAVTFTGVVPGNCNVPTGTLTFFDGGTPLGTEALNGGASASVTTAALTVGSHNITAQYGGDANFDPSVSATLVQIVLATAGGATVGTTTSLTTTPNPAGLTQAVTMTASVAAAGGSSVAAAGGSSVAGGTVDFLDGGVEIGKGTLNGTGVATFTTSGLALGQHVLTAFYEGSGVVDGSVSGPVTETIIEMSFTVTLQPAMVTFASGGMGSVAVQLGSVGGYTGTLTLSIGALPKNVQSQFTPGTVTLSADGNGAATLLLSTSKPQAARVREGVVGRRDMGALAVVLLLVPIGWRRRRRWGQVMLTALAVAMLAGASGCTGLFLVIQQVTPGTYTVPVTATDANQNTQTAVLTLVVTQ